MSSFLTTPERPNSGSIQGSASSSNKKQDTPVSGRRAFTHASTDMLSSPLRSKRLQAFHDEIRRRRDNNIENRRGDDFLLFTQYQSILSSLEREVDKYAAIVHPPDDEEQFHENNDYCHQNDYSGIKDESDFLDEILEIDDKDVEWLVQNMMLSGDQGPDDSIEEDDSGIHGSTTATNNESSFSTMSGSDEDMDWDMER